MVEDPSDVSIGLNVLEIAPEIDTRDVEGNGFKLSQACKNQEGILLVFVRGTW